MAIVSIYGKVTDIGTPKKMNLKHRQTFELSALGKGAQNVYSVVVYGHEVDMLASFYKGKRVEVECFLNGRRFDRDPEQPRYGMELVMKTIRQK